VVGVVLGAALLCGAASGSISGQRFFFTPGPNGASCEVDVGIRGLPNAASCLIGPPKLSAAHAISVTLFPSGTVRVCHGLRCIGNAPEHTPTLLYGRSVSLGPFRCTSLRSGVRCLVVKLERGFLLGRHGVRRI
jgi:hypothetical protein